MDSIVEDAMDYKRKKKDELCDPEYNVNTVERFLEGSQDYNTMPMGKLRNIINYRLDQGSPQTALSLMKYVELFRMHDLKTYLKKVRNQKNE